MNTTVDKKKAVDIILPPRLNEASESALSLCELFIGCVLASGLKNIVLSVDTKNAVVESNISGVKDALTLMLRSKNMKAFYQQLIDLLHKESNGELGEIRCVMGDKKLVLGIKEKNEYPDFSWSIAVR